MQTDTLISFLFATALVTIIPGPNILLIVNDSIRHGIKNGLFTVTGVTIGMIPLFSLSLAGASTLLLKWSWLFDLIKFSGVIYLLYLGLTMIAAGLPSSLPARVVKDRLQNYVTSCFQNPPSFKGFWKQFRSSNFVTIPESSSDTHHGTNALQVKPISSITGVSDREKPSGLHKQSGIRFFFRGVLICITNPKGLLFAGAFFPQFLSKASPLMPQVFILCGGCLFVATVIGGMYAVFAGTAGVLFQSERFTKASALVSGTLLVLFGVSLFFTSSQSAVFN